MFDLPTGVLYIVNTLNNNGFKAYIVGGSIRDMLLNNLVYDWDITTDATPQQVTVLFNKVIPTGIDFGTVTVMLDDGDFEVTTFRKDEQYSDGRRPDNVAFTKSIEEDLSRRDFTINAIAYDPLKNELIDKFDGQKDLKKKIIRTVGDAVERFSEDGLRPMRACRFAAKLNFKIEEKTLEAIKKTHEVFKKVAPERIHDEIYKMLGSEKPSIGFEYMRESGLLAIVMPELLEGLGVEQPKPYHVFDVYYHNIYSCDFAPKELPIVRLAALFHDIAKPKVKIDDTFYNHDLLSADTAALLMKRLKFSNDDIDEVTNLIRNHMFNYTNEWTDAAVRRFLRRVGIENMEDLFLLRVADMKAMEREIDSAYLTELKSRIRKIIEEQNALKISDLRVDGTDVMKELGIGQSPKIGEVLNNLLEKVLDDPKLNVRDKLIELIKDEKS